VTDRRYMTLDRALALADHVCPMPHEAGEALRCLRSALLAVLDQSHHCTVNTSAFGFPAFTFPDAGIDPFAGKTPFPSGSYWLMVPWRADLGTPAALAKEIRDGNYSCP